MQKSESVTSLSGSLFVIPDGQYAGLSVDSLTARFTHENAAISHGSRDKPDHSWLAGWVAGLRAAVAPYE